MKKAVLSYRFVRVEVDLVVLSFDKEVFLPVAKVAGARPLLHEHVPSEDVLSRHRVPLQDATALALSNIHSSWNSERLALIELI